MPHLNYFSYFCFTFKFFFFFDALFFFFFTEKVVIMKHLIVDFGEVLGKKRRKEMGVWWECSIDILFIYLFLLKIKNCNLFVVFL